MSESPNSLSEEKPLPRTADDVLPPVEAPNAGFIFQLFLIPMIIVAIIVMVWLMFSWLAHMESDPKDLVADLRNTNSTSWQKASTLANMLGNPEYEELKTDSSLAMELADALTYHLDAASMTDENVMLRTFLCRALGEFHVDDGLPVLIRAATEQRDPVELDVRRSAMEAIAVLAKNVGADKLRSDETLLKALRKASTEFSDNPAQRIPTGDLRTTATYALGVIGGDAAIAELERLLDDPYANTRYNAATGLARHGRASSIPVLLEMLDPNNDNAIEDEVSETGRRWKRSLVLTNGVRGALQLSKNSNDADLTPIIQSLEQLINAKVAGDVKTHAKEALQAMAAEPSD